MKLPLEIYELPRNGFNFLHDPSGESECDPTGPFGLCNNVDHLSAISKQWKTAEEYVAAKQKIN